MFIGYRGYDKVALGVAFPFGFGLSYTTFALSDLDVALSGSVAEGTLAAEVTVTVTNTGAVAGAEVVQVYVRDVEASVARPVRELKGFAKVGLEPGESRPVRIALDQRAFSFWSELLGRWVVEAGEFAVEVGHHSRDLPLLRTVAVDAPPIALPITVGSTLHEWMADPVAADLIREAVAAGQPDPTRDEELVAVVGTMPMSTLAAFSGMSIDHDTLHKLAERWRERTGRS
jgi:beta-glucosidase